MAGKAKFDQEAAFKTIIGVDREQGEKVTEPSEKKSKKKIGYNDRIILNGILIKHYGGWPWKRKKHLQKWLMKFYEQE